jgi:hypothetical protein
MNQRLVIGTLATGMAMTAALLLSPAATATPLVNTCVQPNLVCACVSLDAFECLGNTCLASAGLTPDGQVGAYCAQDHCVRPGTVCYCFAGQTQSNCDDFITGGKCVLSVGPFPGTEVGLLCH